MSASISFHKEEGGYVPAGRIVCREDGSPYIEFQIQTGSSYVAIYFDEESQARRVAGALQDLAVELQAKKAPVSG